MAKKSTPRAIKQVLLVSNQGSGQKGQALQDLRDILDDAGIVYDLQILHTKDDTARIARSLTQGAEYDAVLAHGGDGTVLDMAHRLCGKDMPLCILPGGTNNALAFTLGQVMSPQGALAALVEGNYRDIRFDVAYIGDRPVILDLHYGFLAKTIKHASRQLKQRVGSLAYAIEAIRQLERAQLHDFIVKCDGHTIRVKAVACYITNAGLPKLFGVPIFKGYGPKNGWLDIALVTTNRFWPLLRWYLARTLFGRAGSRAVMLYRAKNVEVVKAPPEVFYDDITTTISPPFILTVRRNQLPVLVPISPNLIQRLRNLWRGIATQFWRGIDQTRRVLLGMSAQRFSQLDDHLFIGGQPGRFWGVRRLQDWGITAVVSMRLSKPRHIPKGVDLLHLPTPNYEPVKLSNLRKGCEFIERHIKQGGNVYVHCQAGEGRAASMAIAYLITKGMFLRDALRLIKQHRIFIRPNTRQIARLRQFAHQARTAKK